MSKTAANSAYAVAIFALMTLSGCLALVIPVAIVMGWLAPPSFWDMGPGTRWVGFLVSLGAGYWIARLTYQSIVTRTLDVAAAVPAACSLMAYLVFAVVDVVAAKPLGVVAPMLFVVLTVWLLLASSKIVGWRVTAVCVSVSAIVWGVIGYGLATDALSI